MKLLKQSPTMKRSYLLLLALLPLLSYAQTSDFGNWLIYFGNKKINKKINWHNEVQYRNYNAVGDLEQLLVRTGLGYNLTENNNNILVGYGYILSENYDKNSQDKIAVNEHRVYQQFITTQHIGRVKVLHRYRFEQRFVEDAFNLRYRYFLSLNIPLNKSTLTEKTTYMSAYNEIFINSKATLFDRNRVYAGLGYKLNNTFRFEVGYMNQYLSNSTRDQLNLITFINF